MILDINCNKFMDEAFCNVRTSSWIVSKLDPIDIPAVVTNSNFEIIKGKICGLSRLYRHGDCILRFDREGVMVDAQVAVRDIRIAITYEAHALLFDFTGDCVLVLDNLTVRMILRWTDGKITLIAVEVVHLGKFEIEYITGLGDLFQWCGESIAYAVMDSCRQEIIDTIENEVAKMLDNYFTSEEDTEQNMNTEPHTDDEQPETFDFVVDASNFFEGLFCNVRNSSSILSELEPLSIPAVVMDSNFEIIKGKIYGLSSLYRHGDCTVRFDEKGVMVDVQVAVKDVAVEIICGFPFSRIIGYCRFLLDNLTVRMKLCRKDGKTTLNPFKVVHLGNYEIQKITGLSDAFDWLYELIANVLVKRLRWEIIDGIEDGVSILLENYFNIGNDAKQGMSKEQYTDYKRAVLVRRILYNDFENIQESISATETFDFVGNLNNFVEEILCNVRNSSKIKPLDIPAVKINGNFGIKECKIYGLSSLYRHGDCSLRFEEEGVMVEVELTVLDVMVEINYVANALLFWIMGYCRLVLNDLTVRMKLCWKDGQTTSNPFKVVHLGNCEIEEITGLSDVFNWVCKLIINSVVKNYREKIIDAIEYRVSKALRDVLQKS